MRSDYKDMTTERDIKNQIAFAENKGKEIGEKEGEKKGKVETAKNLLKMGMSPEDISKATGLPIEEIKSL